jgi:hypothetical protein
VLDLVRLLLLPRGLRGRRSLIKIIWSYGVKLVTLLSRRTRAVRSLRVA